MGWMRLIGLGTCLGVLSGVVLAAEPPAPRFGQPEPEPKAAGAVRIATYNVENLFDDVDDPTLTGRNDDGEIPKPDDELIALAETIRALDADVLALQEIESREALDWFLRKYMPDHGYEHIVSLDAGNARGIEQSVLSRYPITGTQQWINADLGGVHPQLYGDKPNYYAGEPILLRRSPLLVDLEIPGSGAEPYGLTLIVVHHKSGRHSGYWREAEARFMVERIKELEGEDTDRNIAVLGDFNAQVGEDPIAIYLDAGLIDAVGDGVRRHDDSMTTHESGRRIDFIMVTPNLNAEVVKGSGFVLGTPARAEGADWRTTPTPEGYASDHYPVVVDIRAE